MDFVDSIKIEDLGTDDSSIMERIDSSSDPFLISKDGHPITVLQSIQGYLNMQKAILMLKMMALGEADVRNRRVRSQKEVFDFLRAF